MGRITKRPTYTIEAGDRASNKIIDFHSTVSGHIQHRRMHFHLKWHYSSTAAATAAAAGNSSASTHSRIRIAFGILCPARAKCVRCPTSTDKRVNFKTIRGHATQSDSNSLHNSERFVSGSEFIPSFLLVPEDKTSCWPVFVCSAAIVFQPDCSTHLAAAASASHRSQSGEPSKINHR